MNVFSNWKTNWGRQICSLLWVPFEEIVILHLRFHFWWWCGLSRTAIWEPPEMTPLPCRATSKSSLVDYRHWFPKDLQFLISAGVPWGQPVTPTFIEWPVWSGPGLTNFCSLALFHSEPVELRVDYKAQEMALALASDIWFLSPSWFSDIVGQVTLTFFDHWEKQPDKALGRMVKVRVGSNAYVG